MQWCLIYCDILYKWILPAEIDIWPCFFSTWLLNAVTRTDRRPLVIFSLCTVVTTAVPWCSAKPSVTLMNWPPAPTSSRRHMSCTATFRRRNGRSSFRYSGPPLIRTSLLPNNSVLIWEVSLVRGSITYIHGTYCQEFVLSRGVSFLESVSTFLWKETFDLKRIFKIKLLGFRM